MAVRSAQAFVFRDKILDCEPCLLIDVEVFSNQMSNVHFDKSKYLASVIVNLDFLSSNFSATAIICHFQYDFRLLLSHHGR